MSEPERRWPLPRLLIAGVLILACSALALLCLAIAHQRKFPTGNPALSSKLVGTWVADHGTILQFRSDGTARSRSGVSGKDILYFEWTTSPGELMVFQGPRNHSLRWTINRYVVGNPTDRYEVQGTTPDQFQLLDTKSGKRLQFKRTNDTLLEAAR